MILVTATMWPGGNLAGSYEILHATITNRTSVEDRGERYVSHVIARPAPTLGISGYEADVETRGHKSQDGFAPLLMSVLAAAHAPNDRGLFLPPSRALSRLDLVTTTEFEAVIRSRT